MGIGLPWPHLELDDRCAEIPAVRSSLLDRPDPVLWTGSLLVLAAALYGISIAVSWVGQPFAGFLILENHVVPSAGLVHWPAVEGGEIFQHELLSVDGSALHELGELRELVASRPIGTVLGYEFRSGSHTMLRQIPTRMFTAYDSTLLFGSFIFCGLGLGGVALAIRFLRRDDPAARGSALSLWMIGMWALTAVDLYGPYRLFRAHAFFECMIFASAFHLALVFPTPRRLRARSWLVGAAYGAGILLGIWNQIGLHDPDTYVRTHRFAINCFGAGALTVIGVMIWIYLHPPSFTARQRVKLLALGTVASLAPQVVLSLVSSASGGRAPENLMGWSGVFFPISVAYAVLRSDLLRVDAILRRSLNYALLTGIVAFGYAAIVLAIEPVVREDASESRYLSAIALAALVSLVLLPLRDRIQSGIDRLFFRASYDYRRIVDEMSARFAAVTDLPIVTGLVERVVREALSPESLCLEVARFDPDELQKLGPPPPPSPEAPEATGDARSSVIEKENGALAVVFMAEGQRVAEMTLGRPLSGRFYSGDDRSFLLTLANQGAVAIQNSVALLRLKEFNLTLEQKVEERTAELAETLKELQTAQQQIVHQEKMASIGQLVAGVAHEINNPLNFINGNLFHLREYTETLQHAVEGYEAVVKQKDPELMQQLLALRDELGVEFVLDDLANLFEGCEEGVQRTTAIVSDLRAFSHRDSGLARRVDLRSSLDSTLNLLRGRLARIDVRREYEEIPAVECLEGQLDQVFMNLLVNAADALGDTGTLIVRALCAAPDEVCIEVEDYGCGIPEELRDRIFEPFYTSKEIGKGTGLGLAIAYGVVERHGGRIELDSEVGRGSLFRVHLPLKLPEGPPESDRAA